ncbi:MFS transporter [Streptomyces sp. NPDC047070]|uniref:MFS transporter n=1 Tax=Streptomyces sp. NPDC047070 TaxID=3154923 RepID=UPI003452A99C
MSRPAPAQAIGVGVSAALVAGASLGNLGANLMPVLLPGMTDRFGLSNTAAGWVASVQLIMTALATLAFTSRAARPGRARIARFGLVVAIAGMGLVFAAPDFTVLMAGNALTGAGLGISYAAAMAAIASTDDTDRASAVAVVGATIVLAVFVIVLPEVNDAWGGTTGFAVLALCCMPVLWLVRALPDAVEHKEDPAPERGDLAPTTAAVPVLFLMGLALLGATDQGAWSYSEILGEEYGGMSADSVSTVLSVSSVVCLAGVALSASAVRRFGRLTVVTACIAAEGLCKLVIAALPWGGYYVTAAIVWQICYMGLLVQTLAVAAAADRSGRWVAACGGAVAIGSGLGPAPSGWALDSFGAPAFGVLLALTTAVAAIPIARTIHSMEKRGITSPEPAVQS